MTTTITLSAPPPSTNNLFANIPGKGRVKSSRYRSWAIACGWDLKMQKPARVAGEVALDIEVERVSKLSDVDNRAKGCIDLLVAHGVIDDDRHVIDVRVRWASIKGCRITITPIRDVIQVAA